MFRKEFQEQGKGECSSRGIPFTGKLDVDSISGACCFTSVARPVPQLLRV